MERLPCRGPGFQYVASCRIIHIRVLPQMTGLSLPDEAGHFMLILQRATPRFASDNRMSGTAEENKAVVRGSQGVVNARASSTVSRPASRRS